MNESKNRKGPKGAVLDGGFRRLLVTRDAEDIHATLDPEVLLEDRGWELDTQFQTKQGRIYRMPESLAKELEAMEQEKARMNYEAAKEETERDRRSPGGPGYIDSISVIDEPLQSQPLFDQ